MISTRSHYVAIFHRNRKHLVCVCIKTSWHSSSIQVFLVQFNSTTSGSLFFFGSSNRFSVWIFFCSHFFLFNKLELQATNSGLENIFLRKKLVLSKCNPYVLEIWFVISDLRFYFRFGICGKVTALIITNNWKCMSNYERFSDRYFVWDFITW